MRFKCPGCGNVVSTPGDGVSVECNQCHKRLRIPARSRSAASPPPIPKPAASIDSFDFHSDDSVDPNTRRRELHERKQERSVRLRNPIALVGFAMNAFMLLVHFVSWKFASSLDDILLYLVIATIPIMLAGLTLCIWGVVLRGRRKIFAILGMIAAVGLMVVMPITYGIYDFMRF